MKAKDLRGLSVSELNAKLAEERAALRRLKLNHSVTPLDNPMIIRSTRRNIARLLTELNRRRKSDQKTE